MGKRIYVEAKRKVCMGGRYWTVGDEGWLDSDLYNPDRFEILRGDLEVEEAPIPPLEVEAQDDGKDAGVQVGQAHYVAGETKPPPDELKYQIRALADAHPDKDNREVWRTDGLLKVGFVEKELGIDIKELDIRAALAK